MKVDIKLKKEIDNSYEIIIDSFRGFETDVKVAIVSNAKVSGLHLEKVLSKIKAKELYIITIPDGEEHKSLNTIEYILNRLFEHQFDRKSLLVALGGGVIGDMVGFVASIYQRGIEFIQIPTTLLSQVDASVGGKTGVNNSFGKNLIGAFYQPKGVYIDIDFLHTLPKREFSAGVAEIIKMAVMFDRSFFEFLENSDLRDNQEDLKKAIKKSIELKAAVVSKDEKEQGIRAVLNYGHTFAHVIEKETNYQQFLHGEAVAIGIVMANELAYNLNLLNKSEKERIKKLLQKYNLPTLYKIKNIDSFYESFFLDKKTKNKKITFVLPFSIGNFNKKDDIDKKIILNVLEKFKN